MKKSLEKFGLEPNYAQGKTDTWQISLLPSVSRPRSIIRQLRKYGTFFTATPVFYRFRGEERKRRVQLSVCDESGEMPCLCAKEKEGIAERQATEREIEKEKEKKREENKQSKNKTKTKNKNESWKHKLKSNALLAGRLEPNNTRSLPGIFHCNELLVFSKTSNF